MPIIFNKDKSVFLQEYNLIFTIEEDISIIQKQGVRVIQVTPEILMRIKEVIQ